MSAKAQTQTKEMSEKTSADRVAKVKEALDEHAGRAQEALGQMTEDAKVELRKVSDSSTTFVRENPGAALLGALGVGVLLGMAIRSR